MQKTIGAFNSSGGNTKLSLCPQKLHCPTTKCSMQLMSNYVTFILC